MDLPWKCLPNLLILKLIYKIKHENHKIPDLTFIAKILNIKSEKDNGNLEERIMVPVDSNHLLKRSSNGKYSLSVK